MKYTNVRELKLNTSKVLEESAKYGNVVVTKNGRPVALIRPVSEDDFNIKPKILWPKLRKGAERAGYGLKDVDKLVKAVRKKKK